LLQSTPGYRTSLRAGWRRCRTRIDRWPDFCRSSRPPKFAPASRKRRAKGQNAKPRSSNPGGMQLNFSTATASCRSTSKPRRSPAPSRTARRRKGMRRASPTSRSLLSPRRAHSSCSRGTPAISNTFAIGSSTRSRRCQSERGDEHSAGPRGGPGSPGSPRRGRIRRDCRSRQRVLGFVASIGAKQLAHIMHCGLAGVA